MEVPVEPTSLAEHVEQTYRLVILVNYRGPWEILGDGLSSLTADGEIIRELPAGCLRERLADHTDRLDNRWRGKAARKMQADPAWRPAEAWRRVREPRRDFREWLRAGWWHRWWMHPSLWGRDD
jgi:hypothetical protein